MVFFWKNNKCSCWTVQLYCMAELFGNCKCKILTIFFFYFSRQIMAFRWFFGFRKKCKNLAVPYFTPCVWSEVGHWGGGGGSVEVKVDIHWGHLRWMWTLRGVIWDESRHSGRLEQALEYSSFRVVMLLSSKLASSSRSQAWAHQWIRNFLLPQKVGHTIFVASKLWILQKFLQMFVKSTVSKLQKT